MTSPSTDLVARGASLLSTYLREGRTRTDLLKQIAAVIVDLRSIHTLSDGTTDWQGRSAPYRSQIGKMYALAGVASSKEANQLQTTLRYHVNNRLHEIASAEDLERAKLSETSAKTKHAEWRRLSRALMAAASDGASDPNPVRTLTYVNTLIRRISPADLHILSADERAESRQLLLFLGRRVSEMLDAVERYST